MYLRDEKVASMCCWPFLAWLKEKGIKTSVLSRKESFYVCIVFSLIPWGCEFLFSFFFFNPRKLLKSFSVNKHCGLHGHSYTNGPRKGQLFMDSVLQVTY